MSEILISELLLSDDSQCRMFEKSFNILFKDYYEKFDRYINCLGDKSVEDNDKENEVFRNIQELIKSDIFVHMIGNNKFRKKVINDLKSEYLLGCSKIELEKLCQKINYLSKLYEEHYKSFKDESIKQIEREIINISIEEQKEFMDILENNICTFQFFNDLSNVNII